MSCEDFQEWPSLCSTYQLQKLNKDKPLLKNMFQIKAKRGLTHLLYTELFDDNEKELHFVDKKAVNILYQKPKAKENNRGIPAERKNNI